MAAYPDMVVDFIEKNKRILNITVQEFSNEFNLNIENFIQLLKNIILTETNLKIVYNSILDPLFSVYDSVTLFYQIFNDKSFNFYYIIL